MRIWKYYVGLIMQIILLAYIYKEGKNGLHAMYALQQETEQAALRVTQAEQEIDTIKQDILAWNMHPFYKEKIAREHLHMARQGDIVYYR